MGHLLKKRIFLFSILVIRKSEISQTDLQMKLFIEASFGIKNTRKFKIKEVDKFNL